MKEKLGTETERSSLRSAIDHESQIDFALLQRMKNAAQIGKETVEADQK